VPRADAATITKIVNENIAKESELYTKVGESFAEHSTVVHSKNECVRGGVHSNTVENYFSVFKRGMRGVYQHSAVKHIHRYLAEFDFRYNNREGNGVDDAMRFERSILGIVGKRLTFRRTREAVT
jgi:hypothetical protein